MSTAINDHSLSNTSPITTGSAGSDPRKNFSFDDLLLLPSVPTTSGLNRNYLCYSAKVSPVLPPIGREVNIQRKYKTAPASPNHYDYDYLSSAVTPQTSPVFGRAKLAATNTQSSDCCPVNQQENLPSLRHLQLLPDPRIQEYACYYPDTSEHTPIWKRTLVHWCKEKNYQDYTKIVHEISHDRTQLTALLKGSTSLPSIAGIPSVLKPKDAFHGLSDYVRDRSTPMTPPMSPLDERAGDQPPEFTPFVSSKLVQTVRQNNRNLSSSKNRHKKTNSFKALQLKKMLNNRDILAKDSQTNATKFKISKKTSTSASASASPPSSDDSARLKKLEISSAARNLMVFLDAQTKRSISLSRPSEPVVSSNTSPTIVSKAAEPRPRSRSLSPVRPVTPPNTAASSGYHRFAYDSPQSPVATLRQGHAGSTKITPKRRRSSGSSSHGVSRKCVSCHSNDSPCWRPSWSGRKQDQLCNSCGLRYKKTHTRCLNDACRKIPTKSELSIMKSNGLLQEHNPDGTITKGYKCLFCNSIAETSNAEPHSHV
ncbi:hypothetical protein HG537_0E02060 [Torulaspora globosa]|uniref:GATA-type domain-containing protein n=1 Tax=Torulaspora globosa TaxID=48254 RepID=A0A7H9HU37_9SACH|nr:hypothetical protein HG537_0E02060 [Torulaspora sp. CBS 2947]